tara:strand:+ start:173 stop:778 length:606 start_codon:yes stop_codon:yes gene_type:complete
MEKIWMNSCLSRLCTVTLFAVLFVSFTAVAQENTDTRAVKDDSYNKDEVLEKARGFFGSTTKGLAEGIEKVFNDLGRPNAYIEGEEFGGAFVIGLRYGRGKLNRKLGVPTEIFWQGPSVGFDFGGNVSKVFTLIYKLKNANDMFRRFPGVDGSLYVIAGISLNYQQAGDTVLVPIRTGVGLRAGANVGYLHYNQDHSWLPF